jgi:HEAT repeat protein
MRAVRALALAAFGLAVLAAATARGQAARDLETLWRDATLWEVGSNAQLVPAAREALVAEGERALDFLLPAKLDTKDTLVTRALQVVVPGIGERAVPRLLAALESPDADVRRNAADLLGALKAVDAAPAIAKLLDDADTRLGALSALGALKAESAVPAIARVLREGSPERASVAAAVALGQIGGRAAEEALAGGLADDRAQVRFGAEQALVAGRAVSTLRPLARSGPVQVRLHALSALGRLADPAAAPELRAALLDRDPRIRAFAVEALAPVSDASDRALFASRLSAETDPLVRGKLEAVR